MGREAQAAAEVRQLSLGDPEERRRVGAGAQLRGGWAGHAGAVWRADVSDRLCPHHISGQTEVHGAGSQRQANSTGQRRVSAWRGSRGDLRARGLRLLSPMEISHPGPLAPFQLGSRLRRLFPERNPDLDHRTAIGRDF